MSKIRRTELPVHNVHRVRLVEQIVPSKTTPEREFYTVSVMAQDKDGKEVKIACLYGNGSSKIDILV